MISGHYGEPSFFNHGPEILWSLPSQALEDNEKDLILDPGMYREPVEPKKDGRDVVKLRDQADNPGS